MSTIATLPLTPLQQRLLRAAQTYGVRAVVAAITVFSLAVSLAVTALSLVFLPEDFSFITAAFSIVTLVPPVVAPLTSTSIVHLSQVAADAHARLQVLAATDALTGIANRRHFFDVAPTLLGSTAHWSGCSTSTASIRSTMPAATRWAISRSSTSPAGCSTQSARTA